MSLSRCTCVSTLRPGPSGRLAIDVRVLDPECDYVVHRAEAAVLDQPVR